jgi:hypothetical protein
MDDMWDRRLPSMVGGYFADMMLVLNRLRSSIIDGGSAWMVVGDSQYAGIRIRAADILNDLVSAEHWKVDRVQEFRSMRASAQQGGQLRLAETLMALVAV